MHTLCVHLAYICCLLCEKYTNYREIQPHFLPSLKLCVEFTLASQMNSAKTKTSPVSISVRVDARQSKMNAINFVTESKGNKKRIQRQHWQQQQRQQPLNKELIRNNNCVLGNIP